MRDETRRLVGAVLVAVFGAWVLTAVVEAGPVYDICQQWCQEYSWWYAALLGCWCS